jgi:hypothetical protein
MVDLIKKILLRIKWPMMSPRERYVRLWNKGGSLRHPESTLYLQPNIRRT